MAEGRIDDPQRNEDAELAPEYSGFMQAIHRTQSAEARDYSKKLHHHLKELVNEQNEDALFTYLRKEISAILNRKQFNTFTVDQLEKDVSQLQVCLNNKAAISTSLQNVSVHSQLQQEMQSLMYSASSSEKPSPDTVEVLENTSKDFECHVQLCQVMSEIDKKRQDITEKRCKLAQLQKQVKKLWLDLESRDMGRSRAGDSTELTEARAKLKARQARIEILVHFLLTLVPTASNRWGTNRQLTKIMEACELYRSQPGTVDCERILELLA